MEQLPFEFRCNADDLSLEDYLYIYKTLDEDEFPIVKVGEKKVRNNYPLDKDKRTEGFMKNLHQKVVRHLTDLPVKKLKEDILIKFCMDEVGKTFQNIEASLEEFDCKYSAPVYSEWSFIRWIEMEQRLSKGFNKMNGTEVLENIPGIYWILPMVYGEYSTDKAVIQERFDYFLKELPLKNSLLLYKNEIKNIERIKSLHTFLYNSGGSSAGQNLTQHFNTFGWAETLRSVVLNNAPFGTYKETKEAPLFEVLEFLNINASFVKAEAADYKAKNRK